MIANFSKKNNLYRFINDTLKPFKKYIWTHIITLAGFMLLITWAPVFISQLATDLYNIPMILFMIVLLNICISILLRIYHYYVWVKFVPQLQKQASSDVLSSMLKKNYGFFPASLSGDISKKRTDLVNELSNVYMALVEGVLFSIFVVLGALLVLLKLHWKYNLMVGMWCLGFALISIYYGPLLGKLAGRSAESDSKLNGLSTDILSNVLAVKLFNLEAFEEAKFEEANEENRIIKIALEKIYYWVYSFYSISFVIMLAYGSWHLWNDYKIDAIDIAGMILFLQLVMGLVGRLWTLTEQMQKLITGMGKVKMAYAVLFDNSTEEDQIYKSTSINSGKIFFDKVDFQYQNQNILFKNLTLNFKSGEKIGLVGYSGAGKTTIVNLLLKLYKVNAGCIKIDDQDINNISPKDLYEAVSVITQDSVLFHRSVYENIICGRLDASENDVMEAAKKAQAHDFIMDLDEGYKTNVGERGSKLSGGQRQRIMIARAILKNAKILIMDEVTSQLDSENEFKIQQNLMNVMKDKTTIVIAHRLSTLQLMDRLCVFDKGQLVESGSHLELLKNNTGLYSNLWNKQIGIER